MVRLIFASYGSKRGGGFANELADREHYAARLARFFLWTGDGFERDALCTDLPNVQKRCTTIRALPAVCPDAPSSIPTIGADFPHFTLKTVEHSRYLPALS
jgi:hypothetical protein